MKELEKLDMDGNVLFTQPYTIVMARHLLTTYAKYPNSDKTMWREVVEAPKRKSKSKKDETD